MDSASAAIDVDGAAEKPIIYDDGMQYIDKTIQDDFQNFIQQQHSLHGISQQGMRQSNLWNRWQFLRGHKGDEWFECRIAAHAAAFPMDLMRATTVSVSVTQQ